MTKLFKQVLSLVVGLLCFTTSYAQIDTTGMMKTKSGIYYHFEGEETSDYPKIGDHMIVDIVKFNEEGDVLFDTKALENLNGVEIVLEEPKYNGDITEIFFKMSKGVKASLFVLMDSVDREFLSEKDIGKYYGYEITLRDFKSDKVYQKELKKHNRQQLRSDHKNLKKVIRSSSYVKKKKVGKGLFITWIDDVDSENVQLNDTLKVHYAGRLTDGMQFDSSKERAEPFEFVFNKKNVIKGWTALLPFAGLGDEVTLYIASKYAYGRSGAGKDIGPDEPLIFDVDILELNHSKVN